MKALSSKIFSKEHFENDDLKFVCFVLNKTIDKFGRNCILIKYNLSPEEIKINKKYSEPLKVIKILENKFSKRFSLNSNFGQVYETYENICEYIDSFECLYNEQFISSLINNYSIELYYHYLECIGI